MASLDREIAKQYEEEPLNPKDVAEIVARYRYSILFFTLLGALIGAYIAYFKPDIYQATATVEVGLGERGKNQDVINKAIEPGYLNPDTEIEIITSRFLAKKALKHVDFTHRYYTTKGFKEVELYKDSPFRVALIKGYGVSFELEPIDARRYRLIVPEAVDANGTKWHYDKVHRYGEEVITPHFHLNIARLAPAQASSYRFVVYKHNRPVGAVHVSRKLKYSTILHISYTDNVPLRAKEYANALAKAYIYQNVEKKSREATLKLAFIDKQLKKITENLRNSAVKIEEFKRNANTVNLSTKAEALITQISEAESKLDALRIEGGLIDSLYQKIKNGKNLETISFVGLGEEYAPLEMKIKELQSAIIKKKLLREDYTELYPAVIKLTKEIRQLKKIIVSTIGDMRSSIKEREKLIEKSIARYQKELDKLPADERMYGQLKRKFAVNEKIYSYLLEKRSETAIVKASTVSKNRVIDEAEVPRSPILPKRKKIVLIATAIGLLVGLLLALVRNFFDDTIKKEEDITKKIDVPVLGYIPHIKGKEHAVAVMKSLRSYEAESFRHLRTNLQFMVKKGESQLIAVTSTVGGEGKTTVCINLGAIMSIAGKKTLLINMDMRKPTLHKVFDIPNDKGVSTLLAGASSLKETIRPTAYKNLHVIPSGPVPPNPSELIHDAFTEKMLSKLKEVYDVIIVDTPPVGLVTDARMLLDMADTTIYVVRADYSKKAFLQQIKAIKRFHTVRGLGVVINDIDTKKQKYGYGYGYGGKYGYYEDAKE